MAPALLTLVIRAWVRNRPVAHADGPRGRCPQIAGVALEMDPNDLPLTTPPAWKSRGPSDGHFPVPEKPGGILDHEPRRADRLLRTGLLGATLLVQLLGITPARAAFFMMFVNLAGLLGRIGLSYLSDAIGRKPRAQSQPGSGDPADGGRFLYDVFIGAVSCSGLLLIATNALPMEVLRLWVRIRPRYGPRAATTGMGSAYGFGGIGKVIGPLGLALIVGSSNVITPQASVSSIVPAYSYLRAGSSSRPGLCVSWI